MRKDRLPATEMKKLVVKKEEEYDRQNAVGKLASAISSKTWLIGAKLKDIVTGMMMTVNLIAVSMIRRRRIECATKTQRGLEK